PYGYNVNEKGGWGYNGATHGPKTRKKISKALKGKPCPEEKKEKLRIACTGVQAGEKHPFWGKHHTQETLDKISENRKGITAGKNHHYFGKKRNEETKKKISKTLKGRPLDEETKKKLSEAGKRVKRIICEHCGKEFTPWGLVHHRKSLKNI
ncbi:MAG TPA: NUMOD3 domain-containing DNA-binding protein, partial [Alphaproteobacteria bacterium]|nr:NUMOD3 domain-containing DNA-binding protein [Alphaproteobacteria bacterium]